MSFGNVDLNDLNEYMDDDNDEALRHAIAASIEDQINRPIVPILPDGIDDSTLFHNPVARKALEILEKVKVTQQRLQNLIDMDLNPTDQSKSSDDLNSTQQIIQSQDREYLEALEEAQKREQQAEQPQVNPTIEETTDEDYPQMIRDRFSKIGNEPENGICIAVLAVDSNIRFQRKFSPNELGENVYVWVAARDEIIEKKLYLGEFDLVGPMSTLKPDEVLESQHVSNRTLFKIIPK
ncbi:hypothetical protein GPJ56_001718 [Histomonas meleagridis]|uniref:uncharacterized protein n=1 Tax=Histomonas meleagridis TaxID=135588 RepID=UPI003559BF31|nr:hypothetical protein GPJ56_001718 [Histomonas meleagridis]KAH0796196.1 hypothetical protein GO595_010089 [Histomonas meleagridis]